MGIWVLLQQIAVQTMTVYTMPIFWLAVLLLMIQVRIQQKSGALHPWQVQTKQKHRKGNRKQQKQTANWLSVFLSDSYCVLQVVLPTIVFGWMGGILAGVLLVCIGVSIDGQQLLWLWAITLVLVLLQRRFVCFAYAGGLVTLLQLCLYDNPCAGQQILMLVAVLHLAEAVLVRISGTLQNISVYLRDNRGRTIIGTRLQMTWPVPMVMAVPVSESVHGLGVQAGYFTMPEWWPLLTTQPVPSDGVALYQLLPVLAAIGYHDMTKGSGRERIRTAAGRLLLYSVTLGGLVLTSIRLSIMLYPAALFSILGHEWISKR